ncbi:hypothetical protein PHLCEN_2v5269 [Hermanssonia centrifuga]|uniref:Uncharacterized protein n=1 Tax=Hermanssonia centrifuga TaxID=98765 RepID=A0A2R6P8I7_9APHY|nr:hypothetical protein PHLCEN_2v5269 [Hermanssonia centrifuga]
MLNSMLALLNSRQSLREAMNVDKSVLTGLANLHTADDRIVFGIVSSAINESLVRLPYESSTNSHGYDIFPKN